jgi:hypothetical protein
MYLAIWGMRVWLFVILYHMWIIERVTVKF